MMVPTYARSVKSEDSLRLHRRLDTTSRAQVAIQRCKSYLAGVGAGKKQLLGGDLAFGEGRGRQLGSFLPFDISLASHQAM